MLNVESHPLLDSSAFVSHFPKPLGEMTPSDELRELLSVHASAPMSSSDEVRQHVRNLLRHGGFRPTGRSKPASEYLFKAASEVGLRSINLAVDACNAVSLHSGLPISVVDLDLATAPLHVAIAPEGSSYVFNPSGQLMDVGGLVCLFDADGPCANAVKDSQRTKTRAETRRTLSLIWSTRDLPGRCEQVVSWYAGLLRACGVLVEEINP